MLNFDRGHLFFMHWVQLAAKDSIFPRRGGGGRYSVPSVTVVAPHFVTNMYAIKSVHQNVVKVITEN